MNDRHDRPKIEFEKQDFVDGEIVIVVSKSKTPVPRYSIQCGRLREGRTFVPFIPFHMLDALVTALGKLKEARGAEIGKAKAEAEKRERDREARRAAEDKQRQKDYGKNRRKSARREYRPPDLEAAKKNSDRARAAQQKVQATMFAPEVKP